MVVYADNILVLPGVFLHVRLLAVQVSQRFINGNLKAGFLTLLLGVALAAPGCKEEPTLFGGCSTQDLSACPESEGFVNPYTGQLELLSWTETLRKASLELTGKLPTDRQVQITAEHGQLGLEASLAEIMRDEAFSQRIIELYAEVFEAADALDKLEGFASQFGPDFYGLPRNTDSITLEKRAWEVPGQIALGDGSLTPLRAGESVHWTVTA